ncbi:MAG: extracellular solute-binding protein [Acidimicrobiales bacterium]
MKRSIVVLVALLSLSGCVNGTQTLGDGSVTSPTFRPSSGGTIDVKTGNCTVVDITVSPEKIDLINDLARTFNASKDAKLNNKCIAVRPQSQSSGAAMQALADGWNEATDGPRPVVWSPAGSAWGAILNQRLADKSQPAMTGAGKPFMVTPLVIAMPKPMAEALGYPAKALGWSDILSLAQSDKGWAEFGHPEWGPFRLGKTNPNFSTSGLNSLIAQTYASTGKARGLTLEDLRDSKVEAYARTVESAVVHYGGTTLAFLNNWYRADQRNTALTYVSAVAIEEKSVIDYNSGNPDGVLDPGEKPRAPRVPLIAVYPKEGTLYSDNPFFVLNSSWVDADEKAAAAKFEEFVQRPENQRRVLEFGFRPGNPDVAVGAPITAANGVDPTQPKTLLEVPPPQVMTGLLDRWAQQRKGARILFLLDVSGSMSDLADATSGATKLDLAQRAAVNSLAQVKGDDALGLWVFSTGLGPKQKDEHLEIVPVGPVDKQRSALISGIQNQRPQRGTPLYNAIGDAYRSMLATYDPTRINAVVVLTDGINDDGTPNDDDQQLSNLVRDLQANSEGSDSKPVRVFTIAYGKDADKTALKRIAEAASAATYDASDPKSIDRVFTNVISNF